MIISGRELSTSTGVFHEVFSFLLRIEMEIDSAVVGDNFTKCVRILIRFLIIDIKELPYFNCREGFLNFSEFVILIL